MVFQTQAQITVVAGDEKVELPSPAKKQDIINAAFDLAKRIGLTSFILRYNGTVWENPEDVPEEVSSGTVELVKADNAA